MLTFCPPAGGTTNEVPTICIRMGDWLVRERLPLDAIVRAISTASSTLEWASRRALPRRGRSRVIALRFYRKKCAFTQENGLSLQRVGKGKISAPCMSSLRSLGKTDGYKNFGESRREHPGSVRVRITVRVRSVSCEADVLSEANATICRWLAHAIGNVRSVLYSRYVYTSSGLRRRLAPLCAPINGDECQPVVSWHLGSNKTIFRGKKEFCRHKSNSARPVKFQVWSQIPDWRSAVFKSKQNRFLVH